LRIAFALLPERFVKNETVTGIIGNTQGVSNAMKPPRNPKRNTDNKLLSSDFATPQSLTG